MWVWSPAKHEQTRPLRFGWKYVCARSYLTNLRTVVNDGGPTTLLEERDDGLAGGDEIVTVDAHVGERPAMWK